MNTPQSSFCTRTFFLDMHFIDLQFQSDHFGRFKTLQHQFIKPQEKGFGSNWQKTGRQFTTGSPTWQLSACPSSRISIIQCVQNWYILIHVRLLTAIEPIHLKYFYKPRRPNRLKRSDPRWRRHIIPKLKERRSQAHNRQNLTLYQRKLQFRDIRHVI